MYVATTIPRFVPVRRGLGRLGAGQSEILVPGNVYIARFHADSTYEPSVPTNNGRLSSVRGVDIRRSEYVGGVVFGNFLSDTFQVMFMWQGGERDAADLGRQMAAALSSGWAGAFRYEGMAGSMKSGATGEGVNDAQNRSRNAAEAATGIPTWVPWAIGAALTGTALIIGLRS